MSDRADGEGDGVPVEESDHRGRRGRWQRVLLMLL